MSNLVKHGGWSMENADKEAQELNTADYMKLVVGRNIIRVLPPKDPSAGSPFVKTSQHFIRMPGLARATVFACPRQLAKRPCPACEKAETLNRSGSSADKARASELWPGLRIFVNVIDRNNPDRGPRVLGIGKGIFEDLLKIRKQSSSEFGLGGDFTDPVNGFDIAIERVGTGKEDTRYKILAAKKPTPLNVDAATTTRWIEEQADTAQFARVLSPEEIAALFGLTPATGGDAAGGAAPASGATARAQDSIDAEFTE